MAQAQTKKITGKVIDEDGLPVIGALVMVDGTNIGASTNLDGLYVINNAPENVKLLRVTCVGMEPRKVAYKEGQTIMMESNAVLNEVMVVGYGTVRREAKTGSIATVSDEELKNLAASSVDKMLSGKLAGVQITTATGQPGASSQIRIRGISSINASNEPLYVVDGIPVMDGDYSYFTNTNNAIAHINPSDIESITVLKDAAAASVYGSRAANGVILITTKSGKEGKGTVTARAKYGISALANDNNYGVMSAQELLEYQRTAIKNAGLNPDDPTGTYYRPYSLLEKTNNWMDAVTRHGRLQEYEVTMSGGSARTKYYSSLSYHENQGIYEGTGFKRMQGRINADHEINKHWSTGARVNFSYSRNDDTPMQSLYYSNPAFAGMTLMPWIPIYDEKGYNLDIPENSNTNPLATAAHDDQWEKQYHLNGSAYLQYKPTKHITLKSNNSIEMTFGEGRRYWNYKAHSDQEKTGTLQTSQTQYQILTTSNTADYNDTFGSHMVHVLVGQEATMSKSWYTYQYERNLNPNIPYITSGGMADGDASYSVGKSTLASFFGVFDYNFASRYYLSASVRADGSSKFGQDNQWGVFGSVGASWNIHNEKFMARTSDWLQVLKLRASYGVNGNNNIANYRQYGVYTGTTYNGVTGLRPSTPANPKLSWEKNRSWNVGLDFTLCKRINGSLDWYTRETTDMLLYKSQSYTTGFASVLDNVGSIRNTGVEFQLNADIIDKNKWHWDLGFNISHNKSKVLELSGEDFLAYSEDSRLRHIVGESMFTYYLKDYYGVNPVNGEALFRTEDGELTNDYSKAAQINAGSPEPTVTGGIHTNLSWNGIKLSVSTEFKGGNKVYIIENRYLQGDGSQMTMNQAKSALNYWQKPGDTGCNPKPIAGNSTNSYQFDTTRFLENGGFFRIKDITLSYSLPAKIMNKARMNSLTIYGTAQNLYTFHDVNFWDPERGVDGMGYGIYPVTKSFVVGVELSF